MMKEMRISFHTLYGNHEDQHDSVATVRKQIREILDNNLWHDEYEVVIIQ